MYATGTRFAKAKAANSPRWIRAIERAAAALVSRELVVTLLQHDALVTSPRGSYHVNGHCECEASRRLAVGGSPHTPAVNSKAGRR